MFFHGSPTKLPIGTILRPGERLGLRHNGGDHTHVYMTTDIGWTMSQIHPDDRMGCIDPREYALKDAYFWGYGGVDDQPYVHVVEPLAAVQADPHYDVGPAACRTTRALVVAVLDAHVSVHDGPFDELGQQLKELTVQPVLAA